jgi:hypothetical protein
LCPKGGKFGLTTRALCAVLPEQDTLQGASANPHGHATTRTAGWHHNIAEFAAADGEKGVLTDLCLTPVLTDLCLTLYFYSSSEFGGILSSNNLYVLTAAYVFDDTYCQLIC